MKNTRSWPLYKLLPSATVGGTGKIALRGFLLIRTGCMTDTHKKGKILAATGLAAGIVAASVKRRDFSHLLEVIHDKAPLKPHELGVRDWKTVFVAAFHSLADKNLRTLGAGVAYYSVLAFFPMVAAAVAISALLITPEQTATLVATAESYLPLDISGVLTTQIEHLVRQRTDNFFIAIIALAIALFGASGATKSLIVANNAVYEVKETRGWLAQQIWGVLWTGAAILVGLVVLSMMALSSSVLSHLAIPDVLWPLIGFGRWLLAVLITVLGIAVFYRYGPNRPTPQWHWILWGAALATVGWLITTAAFFSYVQNFANYTQSYSLFAGIIVLMIWLNLSALIILLGAEVNYQLEVMGRKKAST